MKKRILIFSLVICAFLMLSSVSVMAAEDDLSLINGDSVLLSSADDPLPKGAFFDVAERDWFFNYVRFVSLNDIFQGYPDQTFSPNKDMTRAEVVRVLYTLEGEPVAKSTTRFSDVPLNEWYAEEVEWAASVGVVAGYPDGKFAPQKHVSRQDFVSMLYRYANYKKFKTDGRAEMSFPDSADTNGYALEPFAWAIDAGIINGTVEADRVYLRPGANTTRAQVAKMLSDFATEYMEMGKLEELRFFISRDQLTLGASCRLDSCLAISPETAYRELEWSSSDESVITVNRGVITGVGLGTATITCTSFDGKTDSLTITVTENSHSPSSDIADFLELKGEGFYGGGHPSGGMSWYYTGSDGDWDYLFGLAIDDGNYLYMVNQAYNNKEKYGYQLDTNITTNKAHSLFYLWDTDSGEVWKGYDEYDLRAITKETEFVLSNLSTDEVVFVDPATKEVADEIYSEETHFIISQLEPIMAEMGFDFTLKDLWFEKY